LTNALELLSERGLRVIIVDQGAAALETDVGATEPPRPSAIQAVRLRLLDLRTKTKERLDAVQETRAYAQATLETASPTGKKLEFLWIVLRWSIGLVCGWAFVAFYYGPKILGPWFIPKIKENPKGIAEKLPILATRAMTGYSAALIMIFFGFVVGGLLWGAPPNEAAEITIGIWFTVTALYVVFDQTWRMVLSPYLTQYRLPALTDVEARKLYRWLGGTTALTLIFMGLCEWMLELGLPANTHALITTFLTFLIVLMNIVLVLVNRGAISHAMLGGVSIGNASPLARLVQTLWVPFVILYLMFSWLSTAYRLIVNNDEGVPFTVVGLYAILLIVIVVYGVVLYLVDRIFNRERRMREMREQARQAEAMEAAVDEAAQEGVALDPTEVLEPSDFTEPKRHQMETYQDLAARIASMLALLAGGYALVNIWQIEDAVMGNSWVDRATDVLIILLIGYFVFHALRIWIDRRIEEEGGVEITVEPGDEGGGASASRSATLLPLFRNVVLSVVGVSVILFALLELGVNVAPLFAGAGVVGLAIGFGAQALVRDIFSGAFFLFDDAFRKGEYIDIGNVKGTVEKISLRSFQLRHHLGPLHTVPFGEIQFLTNYARDWVMMKLPLRVTYDTDPEKVRKLIKKLGVGLMDDPVVGHLFVQPLKSQGVIEMQDSAMIIRVKFMTKPGDQWLVRKRVFQEIRDLFEANDIKFAHREVTVRLAGDGAADPAKLSEKDKQAIASAALDDDAEGMMDAMGGGDDR